MTQVTAIKAEIMDQFPQFAPIAKVADVQAEVFGQTIRVQIKKGEAKAIKIDGQVVWAGEGDVIEAIRRRITPARPNYIKPVYAEVEMAEVPTDYEEKLEGLAQIAEPKGRVSKVTPEWIEALTEEANHSQRLEDGDEIRLRVATSNGKPVTAAVDIYREGQKIGTGGRQKKINFATRGITEAWKARVDEAVEFAYSKINK